MKFIVYTGRKFVEPSTPYDGYLYVFSVELVSSARLERRPAKIGFCHHKIGLTASEVVLKRYDDINRHHWQRLWPIWSEYIDNANIVEYELHRKYEKYRLKGEWFNLTYQQIKNIKKFFQTQANL